jgi:protein-tyrosine phosphatase
MKYAIVFTLLGIELIALGVFLGGAGWLLCWPGGSFVLVGAAYAGLGPRVFGKRRDGSLAWWSAALLPYLGLTWLVWHLQRRLSREPCCHAVAPGLWLGRRPYAHEVPPSVSLIVDLTAEFSEPGAVRVGRTYLCVPTLDSAATDEKTFRDLVETIAGWQGGVYVHCALGHGRSAAVAAAVLLARGLASTVREAEQMLRQARPGVRLKKAQRALLALTTSNAASGCREEVPTSTQRDRS